MALNRSAALVSFCAILASCAKPHNGMELELLGATEDKATIFRMSDGGRWQPIDTLSFSAKTALVSMGDTYCSELLLVSVRGRNTIFIAEAGESATLNVDSQFVYGSPLNDELAAFVISTEKKRAAAEALYDSVYSSNSLGPDDKRALLSELVCSASCDMLADAQRVIDDHRVDALGQLIFWKQIASDKNITFSQLSKAIKDAGERIGNFPPIRQIAERRERQDETSPGSRIPSTMLGYSNGNPAQLDSLTKASDYTLLFAFDPWDESTPEMFARLNAISSHIEGLAPKSAETSASRTCRQRLGIVGICEGAGCDIVNKIESRLPLNGTLLVDSLSLFERDWVIEDFPFFSIVNSDGIILERGIAEDAISHWLTVELNK